MISIASGALLLVVLQVAVSSSLTSGRIVGLSADLATVVARFVDPTVPLIGTTANATAATASTGTAATTVAYTGSGVGAMTTQTQTTT